MKKFISLFALLLVVSNVSFASELGENLSGDCKTFKNGNRQSSEVSIISSTETETSTQSVR